MPSHFLYGALIDMYSDGEGAPWNFPRWQEITGVNPAASFDFPGPGNWTEQQVAQIKAFFAQYMAKPDSLAKIQFSGISSEEVPGAGLWRNFVLDGWKRWQIHDRITRVLIATQFHPCTIAQYSSNPEKWPESTDYIPQVMDDIAVELFGEESLDDLGRLRHCLRSSMKAVIQRTWISLGNKVRVAKNKIKSSENDALEAFKDVDGNKNVTMGQFQDVVTKVSNWRATWEVLPSSFPNAKLDDMEAKLRQMIDVVSRKASDQQTPLSAPDLSKRTLKGLKKLSKQDGIDNVVRLYRDFTDTNKVAIEDLVALDTQQPAIRVNFQNPDSACDPGVEVEFCMTPERLANEMGFLDGLPRLFNRYRHQAGLTPWDSKHAPLFEKEHAENDPNMSRFSLHWHQLAGAHSIIRNIFYPRPSPDNFTGVLVADDVGLGKTCQSMCVLAFLAEAILRKKKDRNPVPMLADRPYLGQSTDIPDLPVLIVVPGTVQSQWASEFRQTVDPAAFDVMVYGTGLQSHKDFWAVRGPFHRSKRHSCCRIIIASHSSLTQDYNLLYASAEKKKDREKMPWEPRRQLKDHIDNIKNTLFGQAYLAVVLDEAHEFRNLGPKHAAAFKILQLSTVRLVMTATPLQTSTKDISAMGRLVGVPFFLTPTAQQLDKDDAAEIRRIRSQQPPDYEPFNDAEGDPVREACATIARKKQKLFAGHILRRTIDSLDYNEKPLISIPPYETIRVVLKLEERETNILAQMDSKVKEKMSSSNCILGVASTNFYLEYRMGVCFPRADPKVPIPSFSTLAEWKAARSTKFDTCAKIAKHLLSRDDAPEIVIKEGKVFFPRIQHDATQGQPSRKRKVLIYQEFPSLGPLLRNVLSLYGLQCVHIDGETSLEDRAKRVHIFQTDPKIRILIFTKVGASGVNLANADTIIFLDQTWSGQEMQQVRGRAHRQPQKSIVRCYHLLGDNTADVILYSLARGKLDMMSAFLSKQAGKEMLTLLTGRSIPGEDDDLEPEEQRKVIVQGATANSRGQRATERSGVTGQSQGLPARAATVQPQNAPAASAAHQDSAAISAALHDEDEYVPSPHADNSPSPVLKKPKKKKRNAPPATADRPTKTTTRAATDETTSRPSKASRRVSPARLESLKQAVPSHQIQAAIDKALSEINTWDFGGDDAMHSGSDSELPLDDGWQEDDTDDGMGSQWFARTDGEDGDISQLDAEEEAFAADDDVMDVDADSLANNSSFVGQSRTSTLEDGQCVSGLLKSKAKSVGSSRPFVGRQPSHDAAPSDGEPEGPQSMREAKGKAKAVAVEGEHAPGRRKGNESSSQAPRKEKQKGPSPSTEDDLDSSPDDADEVEMDIVFNPRTPQAGERRTRDLRSAGSPEIDRKRRRTYVYDRSTDNEIGMEFPPQISPRSVSRPPRNTMPRHPSTSLLMQFEDALHLEQCQEQDKARTSARVEPPQARIQHPTHSNPSHNSLASTLPSASTKHRYRLQPPFEFQPAFLSQTVQRGRRSPSPVRMASRSRELPVATPTPPPQVAPAQQAPARMSVVGRMSPSNDLEPGHSDEEPLSAGPSPHIGTQELRQYTSKAKQAKQGLTVVKTDSLFSDPESVDENQLPLAPSQKDSQRDSRKASSRDSGHLDTNRRSLASTASPRTSSFSHKPTPVAGPSRHHESAPVAGPSRPKLKQLPQTVSDSDGFSPPPAVTKSDNPYLVTSKKTYPDKGKNRQRG